MRRNPPFLLQRYIFGELFINMVFSLVVITSVFFVGMVIQSVYRYQNLPMTTILTVIPFFLPRALTFTIPLTVLIATVQTFGRLSSDNEITAIRVGGIHLHQILIPVVFLGLIMSAVALHFNTTIVPRCIQEWKHITRSSFDQVLTSMRTGDHEIRIKRQQLSLTANDDGTFSKLLIVEPDPDGEGNRKIMADRAEVHIDRENQKLVLLLQDAVVVNGDVFSKMKTLPIGFSLAEQQRKMRLPLKEVDLRELWYRLERPDLAEDHAVISTELHKRIALSFSSLIFALIGAPLGILFRRGGKMAAFFCGFLLVLVVYYPLLLLGEAISVDGRVPASVGMWLGNGVVTAVGAALVVKVFRQ